jgi:excisionase family DNA binding protein
MSTTETRLLGVRETADRLSVSIVTVYRLVERGALPCVRFTPTSRLRFHVEDVERLRDRSAA